MKTYSMDLRERVVAACDAGDRHPRRGRRPLLGQRDAGSADLLRRRRDTGSIAPKPHGGGRPPAFDAEAAERLRDAVAADDDATLKELAGPPASPAAPRPTDRALRRLGIARKKSRCGPPSKTGPS